MTTQDLTNIYDFNEQDAIAYVNATSLEERQIIDIIRISKKSTFAAKIAQTIISNNFKSISAKQAEILEQHSVEAIETTINCEDFFVKMIERQKSVVLS